MYNSGYRVFDYNTSVWSAAILMLSIMLLSSCAGQDISLENDDIKHEVEKIPIAWNLYTADDSLKINPDTKALINEYSNLRDACTGLESEPAEKIGLYGYFVLDGLQESIFENEDLWWWSKVDGNPFTDAVGEPNNWNYSGENKYWVDAADYSFRAYFPKNRVELQPGSGADKFIVVYDTQVSQYDLMVASKSLKSGEENPVQLLFRHTLAALSFDYQFTSDGVSDKLTSCWLENQETNGFYTSSTLNYEESITWPKSTSVPVGNRIYYWEPVEPLQIVSGSAAKAYATSAVSAEKGGLYSGNGGWLLVIPQTTKGPESLKLCFTTNMGGSEVYRVGLPVTSLKPGHRYTFHIKISSTSVDVKLTIKDWNERKSSYDIDFNE